VGTTSDLEGVISFPLPRMSNISPKCKYEVTLTWVESRVHGQTWKLSVSDAADNEESLFVSAGGGI
jgi:hypothetical protein